MKRFRRILKANSFLKNRNGSAAVEFAFITPIFIFILLSIVTINAKFSSARETQQAASTLSDIVSRYTYMDDDRLEMIGVGAEKLLENTPTAKNIRFSLASIHNPPGQYQRDYEITWTESYNGATPITNASIQNDLSKVPVIRQSVSSHEGDTIMLMVFEVDFESPIKIGNFVDDVTITRKAWVYPRLSRTIDYNYNEG